MTRPTGKLTVFCGPMTAGKTSALIGETKRLMNLLGEETSAILVVKPNLSTRSSLGEDDTDILTHDRTSFRESTGLKIQSIHPTEMLSEEVLQETEFLVIDEAQFFDHLCSPANITTILSYGVHVIAAGLDLDSNGQPFGAMPGLLSVADNIIKIPAVCVVCGEDATRTFRKLSASSHSSQILVGGTDIYEARCIQHWLVGMSEKANFFSIK